MVASDWLAAELAAAGVPGDRIRVVLPGKDLDLAAGGPRANSRLGGGDRDSLRQGRLMAAVCIANWLPRKGILELLEAIAGLPDDVVTLHLVGDTATSGGYANRVRERLESAAIRDRVVVHGLIRPAAVSEMYERADAFVLPSFEEPYGTVWGEAMAAGLPVIGWHAGNLPYLADNGRDGVLVPVGDVQALSAAIERLARDAALRDRLGDAARVRSAARPTWDDTAAQFFAIIHEVLSGNRPVDGRPGVRLTRRRLRADQDARFASQAALDMRPDVLRNGLNRGVSTLERGQGSEIDGVELGEALRKSQPKKVKVDEHGVFVEAFAPRDHLCAVVVAVLVARGRIVRL